MREQRLDGLRVAVLVADDFEEREMAEPVKALRSAGATVVIVSPKPDQVQALCHDVKTSTYPVDLHLSKADPEEFDAVLLPGGALNADHLRAVPEAQRFVQKMDEAGKPIGVICHGPWLLVSAGLVGGRTMTSYHTIKDDIRNAGGHWVDREVVRDRNWVSSRSTADIPAFNQGMIDLFAICLRQAKQRKAA